MTEPYYRDDAVTVYHGDCLDVLPTLGDNSIDAVVTDPPYGLEFMGKDWDRFGGTVQTNITEGTDISHPFGDGRSRIRYGREGAAMQQFQAWCQQWATECLRVLKPGGHLLAFGGTRTSHRLACAIEDAGFEIRDSIAWLYGSGFPKSLDVSKAIDKATGAEREVVGIITYADGNSHIEAWPGGTNGHEGWQRPGAPVGDARPSRPLTAPATTDAAKWDGWGTALKPSHEPIIVARKPLRGTVAANVLEHGTGALNIDACRIGTIGGGNSCPGGDACQCADKNEIFGATKHPPRRYGDFGRWPPNVVIDPHTAEAIDKQSGNRPGGKDRRAGAANAPDNYGDDGGGASRFFPTFRYCPKAPGIQRPSADGIAHPTVKPLDLIRWLIRLVTQPHGLVLDPFAGSGTTAEAAIHEHMHAVVIEKEADYLPVITARLHKPMHVGFDFEEEHA